MDRYVLPASLISVLVISIAAGIASQAWVSGNPAFQVQGNETTPKLSNTARTEALTTGWYRTYGGTKDDWAQCLVQTSDGGYAIAGHTYSFGSVDGDLWLVKVDGSGNMQWNTRDKRNGPNEHANSIIQTSDGGYAAAGSTGHAALDAWLVKFNSGGEVEWRKAYGGEEYDYASSVIQTADGGYILGGSTGYDFWFIKTDANGDAQWNKTFGTTDYDNLWCTIQTADGGYALAGNTWVNRAQNGSDGWLVKTDENGNMQWNKSYGDLYDETFNSVAQTYDGGYIMAGYTNPGHADAWLVKTSATGDVEWSKCYGGPDWDEAWSVVQASDGGYVFTGRGPNWLVKTDSLGNTLWTRTVTEVSFVFLFGDIFFDLILTRDGGYALAGCTSSSGGNDDFLLVKTDENGIVPEFPSFAILPLFMIMTLLAVMVLRGKHDR